MMTQRVWLTLFWVCGCQVPELTIEEIDRDAGPAAKIEPAADSGTRQRRNAVMTTSPKTDAGSVDAGERPRRVDAGMRAPMPAAGSGGGGASAPAPEPDAGKSAADSGKPALEPSDAGKPPRVCAVWRSVNARDNAPPAGAVEGGLENIGGVSTPQYVCRVRPALSDYAVPGKYIAGLGCYVVVLRNGSAMDVSVLDGMFEVLTPAPGCSFSWRKASSSMVPEGAADLGDPLGGPHYACHGFYSAVPTSGTQIGVVIRAAGTPPQNQCFFQSFAGAVQPNTPNEFEVLVQD